MFASSMKVKCVSVNPQAYECIDETGAWGNWSLGTVLTLSLTDDHLKEKWIKISEFNKPNTKPEWL